MSARFTAVSIDDVDAVDWRGVGLRWHPLRSALGTRIVGVAAFSASRAGEPLVEPHVETGDGRGHEEVYLVLRGRARFQVDDASVDGPAGTLVRVDPEARRSAGAAEADTWVIALGGDPTFEPGADEWIERARPWIRSDPARAAAIVDELEATLPGDGGIAVARALLAAGGGDDASARRLVGELLAQRPELAQLLRTDPDLGRLVDRG